MITKVPKPDKPESKKQKRIPLKARQRCKVFFFSFSVRNLSGFASLRECFFVRNSSFEAMIKNCARWSFWFTLIGFSLACSSSGKTSRRDAKLVSYAVAPKTSRADIVTESVIALNSYQFTIEFAEARRNYEALRTNWRLNTQTMQTEGGEKTLQLRDRAILHLSPRGVQSADRSTNVASTLEFEMEIKGAKKDSWIAITPDPIFQEQYAALVADLQNRLRHRGYQFN